LLQKGNKLQEMSLLNLFMNTCVYCLFSYLIKELHYNISLEIVELHNYIRQTRGPIFRSAIQSGSRANFSVWMNPKISIFLKNCRNFLCS